MFNEHRFSELAQNSEFLRLFTASAGVLGYLGIWAKLNQCISALGKAEQLQNPYLTMYVLLRELFKNYLRDFYCQKGGRGYPRIPLGILGRMTFRY